MRRTLEVPQTPLIRSLTAVLPPSRNTSSFVIKAAQRSYKHQYSNIYFVRLRILRVFVEERAWKRWKEVSGNPVFVPRVLDVVKGQLCFIIGTVYMDMPLKPNVLEDLARDHSIPAPPPREKFYSDNDIVTLEDESGRVALVGDRVHDAQLVTGIIMGVLGLETNSGEFEVVDLCFAGMAPQAHHETDDESADDAMDVDESAEASNSVSSNEGEWIALVSGLDIGAASPSDAQIQMLVEYLTGEAGGVQDQRGAARISRLVIAGNSFAAPLISDDDVKEELERKPRRYGHDGTTFSMHPTVTFSAHLLDLARSMPVHLLPGASDPSGTILPQPPFPRAMFGAVSSFSSFTSETNPTYLRIAPNATLSASRQKAKSRASARTFLVHAGQPIDDMYKYLHTPPASRLSLAAATLRWRHLAPTAPDTLWCHPYFTEDPFILKETPDLYIIGNQPKFGTRLVEEEGTRCRVVLVPRFKETGVLVLVNLRTLNVRKVRFAVEGMIAGIVP